MAKTGKRKKSKAQLKKTKANCLARADIARRQRNWQLSQEAAANAGYPINAHITIIAGDAMEAITRTMWRKLRHMMREHGSPFIAVRGPEYTPQKLHHLHLTLNLHPAKYSETVTILTETVSEEIGGWGIDPDGRKIGSNYGVVASSRHGKWMLQRHLDTLNSSHDALVRYVGKGSGKHIAIGRHQRSQDLLELTKAHQEYTSEAVRQPTGRSLSLSVLIGPNVHDEPLMGLTEPLREVDIFSEGFNHA